MAENNALNNRSSTFTVDNLLTVSAGGATISGNSTINGGTVGIGTDNAANGITIGTGTTGRLINIGLSAAAHTILMGNTNTTTSMSLQSGTGNTVMNSAGTTTVTGTGGVSINSISGVINMGDAANANAINIGTGAAARTITVGNTTSTTAVNVDIGTGDFTLDSATGNIITAIDTGEINYPLQPAFLAFNSVTDLNVTGDGTKYTVICDTEVFDQNGDYNNATGVFTAPVTGRYHLYGEILLAGVIAGHTVGSIEITTSNRLYGQGYINPSSAGAVGGLAGLLGATLADMDAMDTATIVAVVVGGTLTVDIFGNATSAFTSFSGKLAC